MAYSNNYKRTVRCSYCNNSGHNRSSCPAFEARIEELRTSYGDEHPDVHAFDAKKAKRKAPAKSRSCSYCSTEGHNRSTCPELAEHIKVSQAKNSVFRKAIYKRMQAHGLGLGAVVSSDRWTARVNPDDYSSDRYRVPHVVVKVNWDNINHFSKNYSYFDGNSPMLSKPLTDISAKWNSECGWVWDNELAKLIMGEGLANQYIEGTHWRAHEKMQFFHQVESPIQTEEPPAGWLEGGDIKFWKKVYKKHKSCGGAL